MPRPLPALLLTALLTGSVHAALPAAPPASSSGLRGLWVDGFGPGLRTPGEVTQTVSDAARLGFNTLFVQTVRRGDCLCQHALVPPAADIATGFDPLAEVIRQAHARHLRVIAWVSVTGAWNASLPPAGPAQVFARHGPAAAQSWLSRRPDGSWRSNADAWLDPGIPAAAEYMARAAVSVAQNYAVDGLQLDRIRYPDGGDWGYSPVTLACYRQETGAAATPAVNDERWKAWKRQQVTALTRRVALEGRLARPGLIISAATIVYGDGPADLNAFQGTRTYSEVLQDWPAWMREGLLDLNVIMNYKRDETGDQAAWFDHWNAFLSAQRTLAGPGAEAAAGTSMYLNTPAVTAAQANRAQEAGLGWVGYAYRTPTAAVYSGQEGQAQGLSALGAALEAVPGLTGSAEAPVPWQPTFSLRRAVLGRVTGAAHLGNLTVQAYAADGALLGSTTTDGNGIYGFASLPGGEVEVRVGGQRWAEPLALGVTRFPTLLLRTLGRTGG